MTKKQKQKKSGIDVLLQHYIHTVNVHGIFSLKLQNFHTPNSVTKLSLYVAFGLICLKQTSFIKLNLDKEHWMKREVTCIKLYKDFCMLKIFYYLNMWE